MAKRKQPTTKAGQLSPAVEPGQPGVREVTDVIELTNAIVKSKYEANANTNALTDALKAKIDNLVAAINTELGNSDWQSDTNTQLTNAQVVAAVNAVIGNTDWQSDTQLTDAEVVTAVNTALGNTDWQTPGGGGGDSRSSINSTNNNMTLTGQYFGSSAPVLSGGGAGDYALTNGAAVDWLNIDGNNTSLNGSSELVITLAGTNRRFTWDVIAANTEQDQDEPALSLSIKEDRSGADMIITLGGLAGFGSAGFTVVLS